VEFAASATRPSPRPPGRRRIIHHYFQGSACGAQRAILGICVNPSLKVDFQGSRVTSDSGLLLVRELDERLGLSALIAENIKGGSAATVNLQSAGRIFALSRSRVQDRGRARLCGVELDCRLSVELASIDIVSEMWQRLHCGY
jgi:hypothetical protein